MKHFKAFQETISNCVNVLEEASLSTPCLLIFPKLMHIKISCFTDSVKSAAKRQATGLVLPLVQLSRKGGENPSQLQPSSCTEREHIPCSPRQVYEGKYLRQVNILPIHKVGASACKTGYQLPSRIMPWFQCFNYN